MAVTPEQLKAQIRFHLQELSTRNAHHDFERLCFEVARKRVCSNIVPATGPVSAGGDQGRDFETFRSYLGQARVSSHTFLGLVSPEILVFACTTQQEDLNRKILDDCAKICGGSNKPARMYFFLAQPLAVGQRHQLQQKCLSDHVTELEVLDQEYLATELSQPDLLHVAEQFLNIPSEVFPRFEQSSDRPDWYTATSSYWHDREPDADSFSSLFDLKMCARFAAADDAARADLEVWLTKLAGLALLSWPNRVGLKACYEAIVCRMRGFGNLGGSESLIIRYLNLVPTFTDPSLLEDASVTLDFLGSAIRRNAVAISEDQRHEWLSSLRTRLDGLLEEQQSPSRRCGFLDLRGYAALQSSRGAIPGRDETMKLWLELVGTAGEAPFYPLERFADRLAVLANVLCDHPDYGSLTEAADTLVGERAGNRVAAEKARDRAISLYQGGHILRAIQELHAAKVKWFSHETRPQLIMSMLIISEWYQELRLTFASKYCALAAAHLATTSDDVEVLRFTPRALVLAAEADYRAGAWLNYLVLVRPAFAAYQLLRSTEQETIEKAVSRVIHYSTVLLSCAEAFLPALSSTITEVTEQLGMQDEVSAVMTHARQRFPGISGADALWALAQDQLAWRPFHDAGVKREVQWSQLGMTWVITFHNDYSTTARAEEFIAVLQIVLGDLAGKYLALMPTSVQIETVVGKDEHAEAEPRPSNEGREWRITLPTFTTASDEEWDQYEAELLSVVTIVLREASLLPEEAWNDIVEELLAGGIRSKTTFGHTYHRVFETFIAPGDFIQDRRRADLSTMRSRPFNVSSHKEVGWQPGLAPTFSQDASLEMVRRRYEQAVVPIRLTLQRLRRSPTFAELVKHLRASGWRDWHILQTIATTACNHRVYVEAGGSPTIEFMRERMPVLLFLEETEHSVPVPEGLFTEYRLREALRLSLPSTISLLGLQLRQRTPDFIAIDRFLAERYNYWVDDVPHADPFSDE